MLNAKRALAQPAATRLLQVQRRVDRPANALQAAAPAPALRHQGILERLARASFGLALAFPGRAMAGVPRKRRHLEHHEEEGHAVTHGPAPPDGPVSPPSAPLRTALPSDGQPQGVSRTAAARAPGPSDALIATDARPPFQVARRLVDHTRVVGAGEDLASAPPKAMRDVAQPLRLRARARRPGRIEAPLDLPRLPTCEPRGRPNRA